MKEESNKDKEQQKPEDSAIEYYKGKRIYTGPRGGILYYTASNRKWHITSKVKRGKS